MSVGAYAVIDVIECLTDSILHIFRKYTKGLIRVELYDDVPSALLTFLTIAERSELFRFRFQTISRAV